MAAVAVAAKNNNNKRTRVEINLSSPVQQKKTKTTTIALTDEQRREIMQRRRKCCEDVFDKYYFYALYVHSHGTADTTQPTLREFYSYNRETMVEVLYDAMKDTPSWRISKASEVHMRVFANIASDASKDMEMLQQELDRLISKHDGGVRKLCPSPKEYWARTEDERAAVDLFFRLKALRAKLDNIYTCLRLLNEAAVDFHISNNNDTTSA